MKKALTIFLIMAFVGVGAVLIFAQTEKRERMGEMNFGGRRLERIAEKLNLTEEQKTQVKTILEDSKTRLKPLMESMRENHKQAENLGIDGVFNEEQVNRIAASQSETMKQLIIEKEKTKARIFAVLTPEQRVEAAKMKDKFKERVKEGFKRRFGGREEVPATEE